MSISKSPWDQIIRPTNHRVISTLRVDAKLQRDIFWGLDRKGQKMLVLHSSTPILNDYRLPKLREIDFRIEERGSGALIALSLIDAEKADLFKVLCDDLIYVVGNLDTDHDAALRLMERSYRWHYLLRSSSRRLLSEREQRGLIAELSFLRDMAMPSIGVAAAVDAWRGPLGAHQDFQVSGFRVEVKSTDPEAPRSFSVSSEHQLDPSGTEGDAVSLALIEIARSEDCAEVGETLTELVESIRRLCDAAGQCTRLEYEQLLSAAGYMDDDSYCTTKWSARSAFVIEVDNDFPAIRASALPSGIRGVRYECDLGCTNVKQVQFPFGEHRGGGDVG